MQETQSEYPKVSIIMPAYNVALYVGEALESIRHQTFRDWECIIVDDGSTDATGMIADEIAGIDSRFKIIDKENGGVSSARNIGLSWAKGKYIAFVDGDDYVEKDFLERMVNIADKNRSDVVQCGFEKDFKGFSHKKTLEKELLLQGREIARELLANNRVESFLWNKLFRSQVIDCGFDENKIFCEDYTALTKWMKNIRCLEIIPDVLYHYRMRKGSLTEAGALKKHNDYLTAAKERLQTINSLFPGFIDDKEAAKFLFKNYVRVAKMIARGEKDKETMKREMENLSRELKDFTNPGEEILGKKLWKRGKLLIEHPDKFGRRMRKLGRWDLYKIFCRMRSFE